MLLGLKARLELYMKLFIISIFKKLLGKDLYSQEKQYAL